MIGIEDFSISLSYNLLFLIVGTIAFILVTIFVYGVTIPKISTAKKIILVIIRSLALTLLLALIFEPIINLFYSEELKPSTYVFVDNSHSIVQEDSSERAAQVEATLSELQTELGENLKLFSFGDSVRVLDAPNNYSDRFTNYESVLNFIKSNREDIANVVTISDGNINQGSVSIYDAENLGLPFYTVGIGDTVTKHDVAIKSVTHNKYIYAGKPTQIEVTVLNTGFDDYNTVISFYEDDRIIESKNLTLNPAGINIIKFNYSPASEGERKISINVAPLNGEFTTGNNSKTVFVEVLKEKKIVSVVADAPSVDLRFLLGALKQNENLTVRSHIQINPGKYVADPVDTDNFDSTDVLLLVGFPSAKSGDAMFQKVVDLINKGTPFLYLFNDSPDINILYRINNHLPFSINSLNKTITEATIEIKNNLSSLLKIDGTIDENDWRRLPPISTFNSLITVKPGSEIIANARLRNFDLEIPLVISGTIGSQRSIALLGFNIWRWKLQYADKKAQLFDQFIQNCVQWLNVDPKKDRFTLNLDKRIYTLGEPVNIISELYDESLNPIENAEIIVTARNESETIQTNLTSAGNGVYQGKLPNLPKGNFSLDAVAIQNNQIIEKTSTKVEIQELDAESLSSTINKEFLNNLATRTGGNFILEGSELNFIQDIARDNISKQKEVKSSSEFNLLSSEWIIFIIIFLLSFEWYLRKRSGMF